ncbi:MAG TPA: NUDIX domain-containing protein [Candidatus Paceibacterota bacterium]
MALDDHHKHFAGNVAQKAVIEKDGKVLVVLPPGEETWDLPGGRLHVGEVPLEGLRREIAEELGLDIKVHEVFFADMWMPSHVEPDKARYFVAFACSLINPSASFVFEKEEIADAKWIGKDEVDSLPLYEICKNALKAYFKNLEL